MPLENESLEFDDGSFTADIPRKRLSELFHVTQDIVSQVNPHVAMMICSDSGERFSLFRASFRAISSDVLQRLRFLAKLNLLPAMFGSVSISTTGDMMMAQRYTGDVTILPRVGGPRAFLNSIQNPDRPQMRSFIREGMKAANKHLSHMLHLLALEQVGGIRLQPRRIRLQPVPPTVAGPPRESGHAPRRTRRAARRRGALGRRGPRRQIAPPLAAP